MKKQIPVILDTDIGSDIDDSWALLMMLNSPELKVELITSATHNTEQRTAITARMLSAAKRTDIPIGTGIMERNEPVGMSKWVKDFDMKAYPGKVHPDGVDAMIRTIMDSREMVTLISIGPVPNIAEALRREPRIAQKARFVGMHGSVYKKYNDEPGTCAEYNVVANTGAAQVVFSAPWVEMVITPLDTCGIVVLDGRHYGTVATAPNPATQALIDSYQCWLNGRSDKGKSTVLFDTVAIHLAYTEKYLKMKEIPIVITFDGFMKVDEKGRKMRVALEWEALEAFKDDLVRRLI
jgi:inosine-uridine nucleoside N-ribohydrolase